MKDKIIRIKSLIKKEFLAIFKDPKSRALIIFPPILELFIFAHAITLEVNNIDLTVLDYSKTYYSRELISRFYNSPRFRKIYYSSTLNEFKRQIDLKKVQAGLIIQNDFSKKINSKQTSEILAILDGRQTNSASIVLGYINEIVSDYELELEKKFNIKSPKINIEINNRYNPNLEYKWFLTVSLIVMLALVLSLLLSSLSIAREKELGTYNQLMVSPLSDNEILFSKTVPPLIVAFISGIIITFIVEYIFKVPFMGSLILYMIATFISLFSVIGVGLFISAISYTQQQAILGVFAFETPAVLLSGFVSPIEDMPIFFQYISLLNPIRYYMLIIKGIYFKNMDLKVVLLNLIPLVIIGIITLSIAKISFKLKNVSETS